MGRPWEQLKRFYWYRDFCFITSCDDDLRFCCKMMAKSLRAIKPRGRDRGRNEAYKAQCAKNENESGLMKLSLSVSLFVYLPVHFFCIYLHIYQRHSSPHSRVLCRFRKSFIHTLSPVSLGVSTLPLPIFLACFMFQNPSINPALRPPLIPPLPPLLPPSLMQSHSPYISGH